MICGVTEVVAADLTMKNSTQIPRQTAKYRGKELKKVYT